MAAFAPEFALGDDKEAYPKEIFLNPQTFVAGTDSALSGADHAFVRNWGLSVVVGRCDCNQLGCMNGAPLVLYKRGTGPKAQWAKQRAACILSQIKQCREFEPALVVSSRALVLRISMRHLSEVVFREVRVPAVMPLHLLARQVLLPCMGFLPEHKAWCFTRGTDGARFGPDVDNLSFAGYGDATLVDMSQAWFIPANQVCANDLFRVEGSKAVELEYDFECCYRMLVQLKAVLDCKGDGSVNNITVLAGQGACPPENGEGLEGQEYHEYVRAWEALSSKRRLQADCVTQARAMGMALNNGYGPTPKNSMFDCLRGFDLDACNQAVLELTKAAFPSRNHAFVNSLSPDASLPTACSACGKFKTPHFNCTRCQRVKYCDKACQEKAWLDGHKRECPKWAKLSS